MTDGAKESKSGHLSQLTIVATILGAGLFLFKLGQRIQKKQTDNNGDDEQETKWPIDSFRTFNPEIKSRSLHRAHPRISSLVMTRNILIEFLPSDVLSEFFSFVESAHEFDLESVGTRDEWHLDDGVYFDPPTIFVENASCVVDQPALVLTIGAPGSGKTTWANYRYGAHQVFAADQYFDEFHSGQFVGKEIGKAHEYCKSKCLKRLFDLETVVVNNTNVTLPEMNEYICAVIFGKLPHKIVFADFVDATRNMDRYSKVLAQRNSHGVPAKKIQYMLKNVLKWRKKGPPSSFRVLSAGPYRRFKQNASKKVLYTGIFLEEESRELLMNVFVSHLRGAVFLPKLYGSHVTIAFQPTDEEVSKLPLGKRVRIRVVGLVDHDLVQCAFVEIGDKDVASACMNEFAHVTLASRRHVQPFYSNLVMKYGLNRVLIPAPSGIDIFGRVGAWASKRAVFSLDDL